MTRGDHDFDEGTDSRDVNDRIEKPSRVDVVRGADLNGVNMAGMNLEGVDLRAADLTGANFRTPRKLPNLRYGPDVLSKPSLEPVSSSWQANLWWHGNASLYLTAKSLPDSERAVRTGSVINGKPGAGAKP